MSTIERLNNDPFLQEANITQMLEMFDLLPNTLFWVKNFEGQVKYGNLRFIEHVGAKSLAQIIDKTDYDFAPRHLAKQFVTDDKKIVLGDVVTNRLELNMDVRGNIAWYSTSKRPLYNKQHVIIGSYGITRILHDKVEPYPELHSIRKPLEFIKENFARDICIQELADTAHISISALERRFKKFLQKTPKQFITQIRLEYARKQLIETVTPIADVGFNSGFSDHSYFSKQYKLLFDELPSVTRKHRDANEI